MVQKLYLRLTEAKRIKEQIQEQIALKDALYWSLFPSGIAYDKDKVQTSPEDQLSKTMAKIDSINRKIAEIEAGLPEATDRVMAILSNIDNMTYRCVMIRWYIGGMKASDIAKEMHYTERGIYKIHNRMIKILEECVH